MPYIGQRPSKGDENNFKILDDISSYTLTFDGSDAAVVSAANDTITSLTHRFVQGQRVTYHNGGGSDIGGLSGTAYFIIKEDHNTIKLASSASNASNGVAVNITGVGGGSSHTLSLAFDGTNTKFKATHTNGQKAKITRSAQLVISMNGVIQQPHDTATPSTGFGFDLDGTIVFSQAPISTDVFWAHVLTNNNVTFDISDNDIDNFTGNGSTVSFNLSKSPPDNRNVLVTLDGVVQYPNDPDGTVRSYTVVENVLTFTTAPASGVEIQVRHIGFAGSTSGGGGGVTNFYGRTGSVVLKSTDNIVANNATFSGNLTVNGTTTTLDTQLVEVDKIEVETTSTNVAIAVTHNGTGDLIRLYDGATQKVTVDDEGNVGIGSVIPAEKLDVSGKIKVGSNGVILSGDDVHGGAYPLKVTTSYGYVNVGPYNASYAHFVTDRGRFYFNKKIVIDEGVVSSYNENLVLATNAGIDEHVHITTSGAVGINTTVDAATKLQVQTDATSTTAGGNIVARFQSNGSGRDATIQLSDNTAHSATISMLSSALVFKQSGTETFRIDSDGQIGIGNIAPDTWSTGHGLTIGTSQATLWGVGDQVNLSGNAYFNSGWKAAASKAGASQIEQALGNIDFKVSGSVTADNSITWINALRITSDGKVGIGTDNPFYTTSLDVLDSSSGTDEDLFSIRSKTGAFLVQCSDKDAANPEWRLRTFAAEDLVFSPGGTGAAGEKVRIRSDGKVGIGTDMVGAPASNYGFGSYRATGTGYLYTETGQSGASAGLRAKAGTSDFTIFTTQGVGQLAVYDNTNSAERLRIDSSGNLAINKTSGISAKLHIGDTSNDGALSQLVKLGNDSSGSGTGAQLNMGAGSANESTAACIGGFYDGTGTSFIVKTAGTYANQSTVAERLRIDSNGKFHMGGGSSWTYASQKFVVVEPNNALGMLLQGNNANEGVNLTLQNIVNANNAYSSLSFADDGGQIFGVVRGKVIDKSANTGELQFWTSGSERFTIDKDGVATFSATNINVNRNAGDAFIALQTSGTSNVSLYGGATTGFRVFTKPSGGSLTERLRITSAPNTASYPTAPGAMKLVSPTTGGYPLIGYTDTGARIASHLCTGSFYSVTGMIIIKTTLPKHSTGYTMFSCRITGYAYSATQGGAIDCVVGCYTGENNYYNPTVTGSYPDTWRDYISFATMTGGTHNGQLCIRLGQTGTTQLCEIAVTDFVWGYSTVSDTFAQGWQMMTITSETDYNTNVVAAIHRSREIWNHQFAVVGDSYGELLTTRKGRKGTILGSYQYTELNDGTNVKHYIRSPNGDSDIATDYANTNYCFRVTAGVVGTGTVSTATTWLFQDNSSNNGSLVGTNLYGNTSYSSNNVVMGVDNGKAYWRMAHSVAYRVSVKVEFLSGGKDGGTYTTDFGDY